jgi:hypothetical protein
MGTREMDDREVEGDDASSRKTVHHTICGNVLLFQIHRKLKKVVQCAFFVTDLSLVAVHFL